MSEREDTPRSPLDERIGLLLDRLAALETKSVTPDEEPIRAVAVQALRDRLRELSRKCTDKTCSIRIIEQVRKVVQPEEEE